jgi:hypothetical protein
MRSAFLREARLTTRKALLAFTVCIAGALSPLPSYAFENLTHAGVRLRVGDERVLGKEQLESFSEYDVWASFRLPGEAYSASGWGVGSRLLASAGIFQGAGVNALVVSVLPVLAFGSQDGRFSVDLGAGLALLSRTVYGQQDFGGYLQAALTFGASIPLYQRFGLGYRFMHYSDGGIYGSDTIGVDFHMLELNYRF